MPNREPTLAQRLKMVADLRLIARERFGLGDEHLVMRHLQRLEIYWEQSLLEQVQTCLKRLEAERAKIERIGDRVPPNDTFRSVELLVGEVTTPHGIPTRVLLDSSNLLLGMLVTGLRGAGKTTFVRLLLQLIVTCYPFVRILLFDPNKSYVETCSNPRRWINIPWQEVRTNPLRAPIGYPYDSWINASTDMLGRGELLHSKYLIQKRITDLFKEAHIPEKDDGICLPPSLYDLRDDLANRRERPGSREEGYRQAALNLIQGRVATTSNTYSCNRGMEDPLTESRVRLDMEGLSPLESMEYFITRFILYTYCRLTIAPRIEPPQLHTLIIVEESQTLLGKHGNLALYQEILLKARPLGVGFLFITQSMTEIDPIIFASLSSFLVFAQSSASNKRLAKDILDLSQRETQMLGCLRVGECFVKLTSHPTWPYPFVMRVNNEH